MMTKSEQNESRFLKIACPRCGKSAVIFGKSATNIKCKGCNKLLTQTQGGKTKIKAPVKEIL